MSADKASWVGVSYFTWIKALGLGTGLMRSFGIRKLIRMNVTSTITVIYADYVPCAAASPLR